MHVPIFSHQLYHLFIRFLTLSAVLFLLLPFTGCSPKQTAISETKFYYDTVITVTLYGQDKQPVLDQCMALAAHYESLLSPYLEGSDIWNINQSAGTYITVSEDTIFLLNQALSYAELSDGLVDPTIGTLSALWNFGSDSSDTVPDSALIKEALAHVAYSSIEIKENQVRLTDPDSRIDLGFIAKGYIADQMKAYLVSEGITSALINLGGNIIAIGTKPDGTPFHIGIQKPFENSGTAALTLDLTNISVVSSGNYERYFIQNDILYHHILSTETGYPADSGLSQVTILSPNSAQADAFSTLCYILGYEKAVRLLESYPEVQAVFITTDGQILYHNFN